MRCAHCNAIIPEGWMRCPRCGKDIQIVPDYNPLEDVLTQEVKGSVEDVTRQMHTEDVRNFGRKQNGYQSKATRVLSQEELNEIQTRRERAAKNRSRAEARRKQQERKKQLIRRRRKVLLILLLFLLLFGALFGYIMYQNSYAGKVAKGYDALQMKEYQTAENILNMQSEKMPKNQRHIQVWQRPIWNRGRKTKQNPYFSRRLPLIHPIKNCTRQQSAFMKSQNNWKNSGNFGRL